MPAEVRTSEKERLGLIRDASTTGALILTKGTFRVDDAVKIKFTLDLHVDADPDLDVAGRIVRVERMDDSFWAFKIGVAFEPPRADLEEQLQVVAARQQRVSQKTAST